MKDCCWVKTLAIALVVVSVIAGVAGTMFLPPLTALAICVGGLILSAPFFVMACILENQHTLAKLLESALTPKEPAEKKEK